jgi:hypothetical protein
MQHNPDFRKEKWDMFNGSQLWVNHLTLRNIDRIYDYLAEQCELATSQRKNIPKFSFTQLSDRLTISRRQVMYACLLLAWKRDPYVRIHAVTFRSSQGAKVAHKVELLRTIPKEDGESSPLVRSRIVQGRANTPASKHRTPAFRSQGSAGTFSTKIAGPAGTVEPEVNHDAEGGD